MSGQKGLSPRSGLLSLFQAERELFEASKRRSVYCGGGGGGRRALTRREGPCRRRPRRRCGRDRPEHARPARIRGMRKKGDRCAFLLISEKDQREAKGEVGELEVRYVFREPSHYDGRRLFWRSRKKPFPEPLLATKLSEVFKSEPRASETFFSPLLCLPASLFLS